MRELRHLLILLLVGSLALVGCGDNGGADKDGSPVVDADPNAPDGAGTSDGSTTPTDGNTTPNADSGPCVPQKCNGQATQCLDCIDNDGDGLIDSADPECLGPCDNTEGPTLNGGVGGETGQTCNRDCYFDFGNGSGNDDCFWSFSCDPLEPRGNSCAYSESNLGTAQCPDAQSEMCLSYCAPITPNGCDCFGCCTFPEIDGYVFIGSYSGNTPTCTFADVGDPNKCKPCTPVADCLNECARCELCIGKDELPDDCEQQECPSGSQACGTEGDAECPSGQYCVTGCCVNIIN